MLRTIMCVTLGALAVLGVTPAGAVSINQGWWFNSTQSGRGWAISTTGSKVFVGGFYYAENGAPAWVISSMPQTAMSVETIVTSEGVTQVVTYTLEGDLMSCANGGPLADPAPKAPSCIPIGRATLQTDNPRRARLTLDRTGADRVVIDLVPFDAY